MCGICGIVNIHDNNPPDVHLLHRMNDITHHRGPDDSGHFNDDRVALAMRRLSIVDLSGGHQPIFNEDNTVCVVLNGEIYNHVELRKTLEQSGHRFKTSSDTEVIVHGYEEWGASCVEYLRGMFAFAIWDQVKRRLIIARDRMGQKPLYYYDDGKTLFFGSEIKSILQSDTVPRHMNLEALGAYLSLGYVPTPNTLFKDIYKLPAAHLLCWTAGEPYEIRPYWKLSYQQRSQVMTPDAYRDELRSLFEESVRLRLMSDVPLGAFLSGGIDSSMVVATMSKFLNQPVNTYSVGFEEEGLNELPFAALAAEKFQANHHEIGVNTCTPELIERLVWHLDEPVADPAAVPTFKVSELARKTVTVVLTGEGGDELFGGYSYYLGSQKARHREKYFGDWSQQILPHAARGLNRLTGRERFHERTTWFWSLPPGQQMLAWVAIFTDDEKRMLYDPALNSESHPNGAKSAFEEHYAACDAQDDIHPFLNIDAKVWLPDDLLMKVDKMSMATSIEARSPFLDHKLVEFAASMPIEMKINGDSSKWILRELAKEVLPAEIFNRPKHSFDVPIGKWLNTTLRDMTRQIIAEGVIPGERIFQSDYLLTHAWENLEADKPGTARQFWTLLNLGIWSRQYGVTLA